MAALQVLLVLVVSHLLPASSAHDTRLNHWGNMGLPSIVQPAAATAAAPSIVQPAAASPSIAQPAAAAPSIVQPAEDNNKGQEEEKREREKKELEEIEKMKQEAKGLVSFTNGTGSYKGMSREFVVGHNKVRERYGVPAMKWNNKLARHARRWSNAMRKDCQLKHSVGNNYGESIFTSAKSTGWNATAKDALWSWSSEEPLYDRLTGDCASGRHFSECGHFSLMVDQKNQKIGCGRAECYRGGVFITCNYFLRDHDP